MLLHHSIVIPAVFHTCKTIDIVTSTFNILINHMLLHIISYSIVQF